MDDLLPYVDAAGPWVLAAVVLQRGTVTVVALVAAISSRGYRRRSARKVLRILKRRSTGAIEREPSSLS